MTIVQVLRTEPDPPALQFPQVTLPATRADFNSRSFFNLHFPRVADMFTHVYRALDETVQQVDKNKRFPPVPDPPAPPTPPSASDPSTVSAADLGWGNDTGRYQNAANLIRNLTATTYGALTPDALRLLASLPSSTDAFTCLTSKALDPATPDTVGPSDDPNTYHVDPNGTASAYLDTLDGRASNVYFYRTAKVNRANTVGKLGTSTPPVVLPPTSVPAAPTLLSALGGDGAVAISFLAVADPAVTAYHVYRAQSSGLADDVRTMQVVATVTDTRPLTDRSIPLAFSDTSVTPYQDYFYRITAVLGGVDLPASRVVTARAFDGAPPPEPTWQRSEWIKLDAAGNEHSFTETDPTLVAVLAVKIQFASSTVARALVQVQSGTSFKAASAWLDPTSLAASTVTFATYLRGRDPTSPQTIRSRAVSRGGLEALSAPRVIPAP
jgi:hypothetical protein